MTTRGPEALHATSSRPGRADVISRAGDAHYIHVVTGRSESIVHVPEGSWWSAESSRQTTYRFFSAYDDDVPCAFAKDK